ncbi:hypothetical protein LOTGIDRAFT_232357 [Lottia gigantea]|uniref:Stabilizer of axonemal microtubules 2 n=1 Tax=Lottia gigantea TaxID=225164 RepID=V4AH72_LOTGI|nr:hypothetical protein LOTGIDRAFT_232357 [Lottia gigantea]ESO94530.1 hypothetical protein LOTGIDRAFT_232357 [Lottia gigantea]
MVKRCICEICTCGRHRCPHRPNAPIGRGDRECLLTEYNTTYRQHPMQPRESFKPPNVAVKADAAMDDKTTHRVDYIPHPVDRPALHQPDAYKTPQGDFDMLTSYTKDYVEKGGPRAVPIKHEGLRQLPARFEGEPTYQSDYRKWPINRQPAYGDQGTWKPPTQQFVGETTFARDFQRYNQAPRKSMKPQEATKASDIPFDGRTGYRDYYIKHPLEARQMRQPEKFKPSGIPFDGLSTFRRDYTGPMGQKTESCKPLNQAFQSSAPLEDMTTFKNDYRRWATERPRLHDPDPYRRPEGDMDMNTTHQIAFKEHPLQKHMAKRPASATGLRPGTFDDTTNYKTDFRPWELGQRMQPTMKPDYNPSNAPFEGMPTYKAHYIKHPINPMKSCKPDNSAIQSDAQFEDGTMYRMDYTPKKIAPCPAAIIETGQSTFRFDHIDGRGHKVYQPVYETITPLNGATTNNLVSVPVA